MKYVIDLTKENFDRIDFTEADIIDLYCQYTLPGSMEFKVWGATLLLSPRWKHAEKLDDSLPKDDMYVAGEGIVKIDGLIGGSIEVYAYDNIRGEHGRTYVAKNSDGSELVYRRNWEFDETRKAEEYLWECVICWPYGFCNLRLFSENGKVTYEFDSKDMVSADDYINDPFLYSFSEHHSVK